MLRFCTLVLLLTVASVVQGQNTLFSDDFETGFDPAWHNHDGWAALGGQAYCYEVSPRSPAFVGDLNWYDYTARLEYMPLGDDQSHTPEFEFYFCSKSTDSFENSYRCDFYENSIRMCQYRDGNWDNLGSVAIAESVEFQQWYVLEIQRDQQTLRARRYPLGESAPAWQLELEHDLHLFGAVAITGHYTQCYVDNVEIVGEEIFVGPIELQGNLYLLEHRDTVWEDALLWAREQELEGMLGHLATVTSNAEQAFLEGQFNLALTTPRLGGYQDHGAGEPGEGWAWSNGEAWEYTAWASGQPDQGAGDEDYLALGGDGWMDVANDQHGWYLIEFEEEPVATETTSWSSLKEMFR